ncbi:MAG: SDR family NAD(P)-dependent oxidoreductase, partial [Phormidesmis sp.]
MLKHNFNWAEKTAVITGGGSGIGRATAIALAKKGATVHLVDLRQERITAVLDESIVRTEKGEKIVKKAIRAYGLVNTTKPTKMAMPAIIPGLLSKVGYL